MRVRFVLLTLIAAAQLCADHRCAVKINKGRNDLTLYVDGEPASIYKVGTGLNKADKARSGDMTTPEGIFEVVSVEPADAWDHQFADAARAGAVHCYGPHFIRLSTRKAETFSQRGPWEGIGIHGTMDSDLYSDDGSRVVCGPSSLGKASSEGCVRMLNSQLLDLMQRIRSVDGDIVGVRVTIVDGATRH